MRVWLFAFLVSSAAIAAPDRSEVAAAAARQHEACAVFLLTFNSGNLLGPAAVPVPVFLAPAPPGLTAEQLALWDQIAAHRNWGNASLLLRQRPNVLTREQLWDLARIHYERGLQALLGGGSQPAHWRYLYELLGPDTDAFLAHEEDLER